MELQSTLFELNLKFVSDLPENLKTKYYEQYETAKEDIATLQNFYYRYGKTLTERIEFGISLEKVNYELNFTKQELSVTKNELNVNKQELNFTKNELNDIKQELHEAKQKLNSTEHELSQLKVFTVGVRPASEVVSASSNCPSQILPKTSFVDQNVDKKMNDKDVSVQKENRCQYVPIFSADFHSDMEDESFEKHKSPPRPTIQNSVQINNSPVLSKRKKHVSKRNNSSISNTSVTSSNDSKLSLTNTPKNLDKIMDEIDNDIEVDCEKNSDRDPLKEIDNTLCTTPKGVKKNINSILSVSKVDYVNTDVIEKGKKLRQSKLSLKKVIPIIDISKDVSDDKNDFQMTNESSNWNETFFNNEFVKNNNKHNKKDSLNLCESDWIQRKESQLNNNSANQVVKKNTINYDPCDKDDELIETSPAGVPNEKSKLRNKLSLNLKPEMNKIKSTSSSVTRSKESRNNFLQPISSKQTNSISNDKIDTGVKRKPIERPKTLSDDTYFSLAEASLNKSDCTTQYDMDTTNFEDELKCQKPPLKKILMSSFDIIPGRQEKSPEYAYKEAPVRKKDERAKLPGWSCRDCEKWYDHLPENEKRKRQNECSRHRAKYKPTVLTPDSFWNPVCDDTSTSSFDND